MTSRLLRAAPIVGLFSAVGCGGASSRSTGGQPAQLDQVNVPRDPETSISADVVSTAVTANNAFAVDLYSRLNASAGSSNLLTSPLSASLALTMTYAGAVGNTAAQMASALHFTQGAGPSIFDGQNAMSQILALRGGDALEQQKRFGVADASASDYELQLVNSVWGQSGFAWATPFLTTLAKSYGAGVYLEDFAGQPEAARLAINAWVSGETDDKIENLLPQGAIDSAIRMVLVNAVHLRFPWATAFDPNNTAAGSFTRPDGSTVSPSFMNETMTLPFVDDGQAQVVELPLVGDELAVEIALPHADRSLAAYEAELTVGSAALAHPLANGLVTLSIPKVTFTSPTFSLAQALKAMGMVDAFDHAAADFTGMCASPADRLYIVDVLQKAMVSMQETGVEAAAATAVLAGTTGAPPSPPKVTMTVNRPYLVTLLDIPTGAVVFLGHVVDPTDAGAP